MATIRSKCRLARGGCASTSGKPRLRPLYRGRKRPLEKIEVRVDASTQSPVCENMGLAIGLRRAAKKRNEPNRAIRLFNYLASSIKSELPIHARKYGTLADFSLRTSRKGPSKTSSRGCLGSNGGLPPSNSPTTR